MKERLASRMIYQRKLDQHIKRLRAHIAVALDFWTWRRLAREGLEDQAAAALMTDAAAATADA